LHGRRLRDTLNAVEVFAAPSGKDGVSFLAVRAHSFGIAGRRSFNSFYVAQFVAEQSLIESNCLEKACSLAAFDGFNRSLPAVSNRSTA
jgi:hypothetical protein